MNERSHPPRDISLLRTLNLNVPFLRLPEELLREIASEVAEIWSLELRRCSCSRLYGHRRLGWVLLGHVCHTLRDMLLKHATLWAKSVSVVPLAQPDILLRAKAAPPTFVLNCEPSCPQYVLRVGLTSRYLSLAKSIDICWHPHENYYPFSPDVFSAREFRSLETLSVFLIQRGVLISEPVDPHIHLAWELPPMRAPRLRTLSIRAAALPFEPSTLTSLTLEYATMFPSASFFLDMLRKCVNLQILSLSESIPEELVFATKPSISLPCLSQLTIDDDTDPLLVLVSHLSIPATAQRTFKLQTVPPDAVVRAARYLAVLGLEFPAGVDGIGIWHGECNNFELRYVNKSLSAQPQPDTSELFEQGFSTAMLISAEKLEDELFELKSTIILASQAVPSKFVKYLDLVQSNIGSTATFHDYDEQDWEQMLSPFINVHTLRHDDIPPSILPALTMLSSAPTPLLPSLRHLHIGCLDLRFTSPSETSGCPTTFELAQLLDSRKQAGIPLTHLTIEYMVIDKNDISGAVEFLPFLMSVVDEVDIGEVW